MSVPTLRFDRAFLASELERMAREVPDNPVGESDYGRYHVELNYTIQDGKVAHRKAAAYFESAEIMEAH